jgi:uncharacterized protein (DUF342 family)
MAAMAENGIRVEVAPDGMAAALHVPGGASMPASRVLDLLIRANVTTGVVESEINQAAEPTAADRVLTVARGIPPQPSVDGRIEMLVDFAVHIVEGADHRVDFHETGRFREVAAGTPLARLIPQQDGTPGKTVLGKDLPVRKPVVADLTAAAGEGTRIEPTGAGVLVAAQAGMVVRRHDGHLDVLPKVEIPGDLDMHWGNIDTSLPVSIRGDIVSGFSLKTGGDLEVRGAIEDARVSVKGNLTCTGILPGKHRVKAHGDITTQHVAGRELKCRCLTVGKDMRGVTVYAVRDVTAKGVVSCRIHAGGNVVCQEVGHPDELGGMVQAGADPFAMALFTLAVREHDAIAAEVVAAKQRCKKLAVWLKKESVEHERQRLAHQLQEAFAAFEQACHRLSDCEGLLRNQTLRTGNNPDATITIERAVHPGVEIRLGCEARHVVQRAMGHTVFRLKDNKVVWE